MTESDASPRSRALQLGLIEGMDYYSGGTLSSVIVGTNADLVSAVAPWYLQGRVLDVTYGRGAWWRRWRPESIVTHDLAIDGVDFRDLPHPDRAFDSVVFDPPYVPRQGPNVPTRQRDQAFRSRYGLDVSRSAAEIRALIREGLQECCRVGERFVLAKCGDYTNGRAFHLGHLVVLDAVPEAWTVHDLIIHAGSSGPGGSRVAETVRARRCHSYLIVLRRGPKYVR